MTKDLKHLIYYLYRRRPLAGGPQVCPYLIPSPQLQPRHRISGFSVGEAEGGVLHERTSKPFPT